MTAYSSNASGNFSTSTIWTPNGIPGDGDTVSIGHAVTITTAAICGTSGANGQAGTGTVGTGGVSSATLTGSGTAFTTQLRVGDRLNIGGTITFVTAIGSNTSLTMAGAQTLTAGQSFTFDPAALYISSAGSLTINGTASLELRGNGVSNDAVITLAAGAVLTFNASLATPTSTPYALFIGILYSFTTAKLVCNGTSGSHCTITSNAGGGNGYLTGVSSGNGCVTATYTDFTRIGDATNNNTHWFYLGQDYSCTFCTFTACGQFLHNNIAQGISTFGYTNCVFSGSVGTNCLNFSLDSTVSTSPQLTNNVFDKNVAMTPAGLTITGNYFEGQFTISDQTLGNEWAAFSGNFVNHVGITDAIPTIGNVNDSFVFRRRSDSTNPHFLYPGTTGIDVTYDQVLFQCAASDGVGDCVLVQTNAAAARTITVKRCIFLPDQNGQNSGTPVTLYGSTSITLDGHHNTYLIGIQGMSYGEDPGNGYVGHTDAWQWRSNIAWDTSARGHIMYDGNHGSAFDAAANSIQTADYNNGYNYILTSDVAGSNAASLAKGYACSNTTNPFHSAPGTHDLNVDPQFADYTRSLATFDSLYLGNSATAWVTAHSYVVGDMVSVTTTGVWYGKTANYRCITAHTSASGNAATGVPGVASTWCDNWELASVYRIRQAIAAGTTITDSTLGLTNATYIQACNAWVRAGFAPTNAALHSAAHDGTDIGAVAYSAPVVSTVPNRLSFSVGLRLG